MSTKGLGPMVAAKGKRGHYGLELMQQMNKSKRKAPRINSGAFLSWNKLNQTLVGAEGFEPPTLSV
jgi:hypothetical protein